MADEPTGGAAPSDTPAAAPAASAAPAPAAPAAPVQWFLADGVPGVGDPPPYYKADKYKSLAEQAKAYTDLESLHGKKMAEVGEKLKGHAGAPEAYELKMPDDWKPPEGVDFQPDPEDPLAKAAMDIGKKHGLTQEVMSELYAAFVQHELSDIPDPIALKAAFEPDDVRRQARLGAITDILRANLSEDEYNRYMTEALSTVPDPLAVLQLTERLLQLNKPPRTVPDAAPQATRDEQVQRWRAMQVEKDAHGNFRLSNDPIFRRQYEELGAKLFPGERREVVGTQ